MFIVELNNRQVDFLVSMYMYAQLPLMIDSECSESDEQYMEKLLKENLNTICGIEVNLDSSMENFSLKDDFDTSVAEYVKTKEGKKHVLEYAIDNDLQLESLDDDTYVDAIRSSLEAREYVWLESISKTIERYANDDRVDLKSKKAVLFALLNLANLTENETAKLLINHAVCTYQKQACIDNDYLDELTSLSKKYLSLRKDALEIITE